MTSPRSVLRNRTCGPLRSTGLGQSRKLAVLLVLAILSFHWNHWWFRNPAIIAWDVQTPTFKEWDKLSFLAGAEVPSVATGTTKFWLIYDNFGIFNTSTFLWRVSKNIIPLVQHTFSIFGTIPTGHRDSVYLWRLCEASGQCSSRANTSTASRGWEVPRLPSTSALAWKTPQVEMKKNMMGKKRW